MFCCNYKKKLYISKNQIEIDFIKTQIKNHSTIKNKDILVTFYDLEKMEIFQLQNLIIKLYGSICVNKLPKPYYRYKNGKKIIYDHMFWKYQNLDKGGFYVMDYFISYGWKSHKQVLIDYLTELGCKNCKCVNHQILDCNLVLPSICDKCKIKIDKLNL